MTSKEKSKFRTTKRWKDFRRQFIKANNNRCFICGVEKKGRDTRYLQVHHLDPDHYTDLTPRKFVCLCSSCHNKGIERFLKRKDFNIDEYCERMKEVYVSSK